MVSFNASGLPVSLSESHFLRCRPHLVAFFLGGAVRTVGVIPDGL